MKVFLMGKILKPISFLFYLLFSFIYTGQGPVDGILAVVGKNTILHTDVLQQAQMIALQQGINLTKMPHLFDQLYNETLANMIDQYVLLSSAEKDTTIEITSKEVDSALEVQLQDIIDRAGSEQALVEALGIPIRQIRKDYWDEIKKMMLIDRFQYNLFSGTTVSRKEVVDFYTTYKDSLPASEPKIKFSIIEIPFVIRETAKKIEYNFISELRNTIEQGASFEEIAIEFSDDPGSAPGGGDLGYMKRGTLVSEYEEEAFSLELNEISSPILSPFGYHLIQLLDKKGESIHTRHILRLLKPSPEDKMVALEEIRNIYSKAQHDPGLFDSLAQEFKFKYKNTSGVYPLLDLSAIPINILKTIEGTNSHTLSFPFESEKESAVLIYVFEKTKSVSPTLDNSWELIKGFAKNEKINKTLKTWLNKNKRRTYIKIFKP